MDDGFLTVALACLCAGTVIIYEHIQIIYLGFAILQNHTASQIAREQMDNFYDPKWRFAYVFLLWTTVFAVKWCYFAFFHPFLQAMSNWKCFVFYYRFSICLSVASWLFTIFGTQLVSCTHVRRISESSKCLPELHVSNTVLLLTTWAIPFLDALTDIMGMYSFRCIIFRD